jgi:hypothetical protein
VAGLYHPEHHKSAAHFRIKIVLRIRSKDLFTCFLIPGFLTTTMNPVYMRNVTHYLSNVTGINPPVDSVIYPVKMGEIGYIYLYRWK